jgi:2-polyprenyl-3-methyl-5-hydroxy-6-metoxy-1,4-benzoquinol methylase
LVSHYIDTWKIIWKKIEPDEYKGRIAGERRHFENLENFSALPGIVHWWSSNYLRSRIEEIFGYSGGNLFYLNPILSASDSFDQVVVGSLGSGDGEVEISLAKALMERKVANVQIIGMELSSDLVKKSNFRSKELGLNNIVQFQKVDVNSGFGSSKFHLIIANQVLHHIVSLEGVFDTCHEALTDDGFIMTRDMIGKNGHQAWPEAKGEIDKVWESMPSRYKTNNRNGNLYDAFPNDDFSKSGFEGIRSQDIMPLINERFGYSKYYAFGGIVERFINRGFGGNFSEENEEDTRFVELLQKTNDDLIDSGKITPTQICAYFTKRRSSGKHWKNRTPIGSVRYVV